MSEKDKALWIKVPIRVYGNDDQYCSDKCFGFVMGKCDYFCKTMDKEKKHHLRLSECFDGDI